MKVLDLFSGIGGFSLGLERAGMETVAFCEIEDFPRRVLKKHWPNVPIFKDVRTLHAKDLPEPVELICGGFPCQDLSKAGKMCGFEGERSSLYREMLRIISECKPRYAIFENVTALLSGDSGRWFATFLYDLAEVGYNAEWHCIKAYRAGLQHARDRVWIVAYPSGDDGFKRCFVFKNILRGTPVQLTRLLGLDRGYREIGEWETGCQPRMVRDIDGIPEGLDRLKAIGNAVVPAIPEIIGNAIMDYEHRRNKQ